MTAALKNNYMKIIVLSMILVFSTTAFAQKNLVKNGGFETELSDWVGDGAVLNPYEAKVGKNSCSISQYTGADWKGISQEIYLPKDAYALQLSTWIKTVAVENGKEAYNAGVMTIEFLTNSNENISYENVAQVKGTTGWTEYDKMLVIPKKARKIKVLLALAQTTGSIVFDEVKAISLLQADFEKVQQSLPGQTAATASSEMPVVFTNGNFEAGLAGWNGTSEIEKNIVKEGKNAVAISSQQPTWTGIYQMADIPANAKKIMISGWLKAENIIQGKEAWNNGSLTVEFTKEGSTRTADYQNIGMATGSTEWTYVEQTYNIPQQTGKFKLLIALNNCTGKLLADDVQVKFLNE